MKKSPWLSVFNCASCNGCDLEVLACLTPRYDIERFGCLWRSSPRHADILLVTGMVNKQSKKRLKTIFGQMSKDKYVVAIGSCAIGGGPFHESYNMAGPLDKALPVHMYIPGCPPRPETIMDGLIKLLGELE